MHFHYLLFSKKKHVLHCLLWCWLVSLMWHISLQTYQLMANQSISIMRHYGAHFSNGTWNDYIKNHGRGLHHTYKDFTRQALNSSKLWLKRKIPCARIMQKSSRVTLLDPRFLLAMRRTRESSVFLPLSPHKGALWRIFANFKAWLAVRNICWIQRMIQGL